MNRQRLSMILLFALALAAGTALLRRRQEAPEGPTAPPMPEPPEPPRIVLPQSVLEEQEDEEQPEQQPEAAPAEPPLLERGVGEPLDPTPPRSTSPAPAPTAGRGKSADSDDTLMGYCMHCRERRPVVDGEEVTTESGRRALSGTCPECGTRIFRFLPSKE